jgi:hypothetical protein
MTLDEAKALMQPTAVQHLKDMVAENVVIDTSKKSACDILMSAFIKAVEDDTIHKLSLNQGFVNMLNSTTNTMSQSKLEDLMKLLNERQPEIGCVFTLYDGTMEPIEEWVFKTTNPTFNGMYEYVIKYFQITPSMIREKLSTVLKQTIANNIAQFCLKYQSTDNHDDMVVSITTITRLVNMMNHIITCEFREV